MHKVTKDKREVTGRGEHEGHEVYDCRTDARPRAGLLGLTPHPTHGLMSPAGSSADTRPRATAGLDPNLRDLFTCLRALPVRLSPKQLNPRHFHSATETPHWLYPVDL